MVFFDFFLVGVSELDIKLNWQGRWIWKALTYKSGGRHLLRPGLISLEAESVVQDGHHHYSWDLGMGDTGPVSAASWIS